MNENPEGTPNPLDSGSAVPQPVSPEQPIQPMPEEPVAPVEPTVPMPGGPVVTQPLEPEVGSLMSTEKQTTQAAEIIETMETVADGSVADSMTTEPKGSVVEAKDKKSGKKLAVILAAVFLLVALCTAVAAIVILKPFGGQDAVPAAMTKLMNGAPNYVIATGTVKVTPGEGNNLVPSVSASFTAGIDNKNRQNYVDATITADVGTDEPFTFTANEVHTSGGDLYLKLGGIAAALGQYSNGLQNAETKCIVSEVTGETVCPENTVATNTLETNCVDDGSGLTNCGSSLTDCTSDESGLVDCATVEESKFSVLESLGLFSVIDDEWIMIPGSTFSSVSDLGVFDDTTQCLIDAAGNLGQYGSGFAKMYEANPFINYSTDNIKVAKKKDTIYRLSFNAQNLAEFINSMSNSGFMNELNACTGEVATNVSVSPSDLTDVLAEIPAIYVEIDDNDNFTRVFFTTALDDSGVTVTVDISFSYPSSITVTEPADAIQITTLLSQVLGQFYGTDVVQGQ